MKKFVIIGSGVAAFEAAVRIRKADAAAEIVMCTAENVLPYRRPMLPKLLASDTVPENFFLRDEAFFAGQKIKVVKACSLLNIERDKRMLHFDHPYFREQTYDKLLLAVGGYCFVPQLIGLDKVRTYAFRNYEDALTIRRLIKEGNREFTVVGGGVLGLELAEMLYSLDCGVTIVEGCERLRPKEFTCEESEAAAAVWRARPRAKLVLGALPLELKPYDRMQLSDGRDIAAPRIIFSAGIRPNIAVAQSGGLAVSKFGIIVNSAYRTSDANIYAAGDCASIDNNPAPGLYLAARDAGITVGQSMTEDIK